MLTAVALHQHFAPKQSQEHGARLNWHARDMSSCRPKQHKNSINISAEDRVPKPQRTWQHRDRELWFSAGLLLEFPQQPPRKHRRHAPAVWCDHMAKIGHAIAALASVSHIVLALKEAAAVGMRVLLTHRSNCSDLVAQGLAIQEELDVAFILCEGPKWKRCSMDLR